MPFLWALRTLGQKDGLMLQVLGPLVDPVSFQRTRGSFRQSQPSQEGYIPQNINKIKKKPAGKKLKQRNVYDVSTNICMFTST